VHVGVRQAHPESSPSQQPSRDRVRSCRVPNLQRRYVCTRHCHTNLAWWVEQALQVAGCIATWRGRGWASTDKWSETTNKAGSYRTGLSSLRGRLRSAKATLARTATDNSFAVDRALDSVCSHCSLCCKEAGVRWTGLHQLNRAEYLVGLIRNLQLGSLRCSGNLLEAARVEN